ncbi:MAG: urease accessory protein [Nitrospirae bacterium]|jgi:high-affinity nickel permease|nr:MAG: urease accessory protein [Nitrospirota bacterium]
MADSHIFSLLSLGFLLGLKHALDADHVAAILTIATENRTFWRSSLIGFCWGVGHTVILLVVGTAVLLFKLTIPSAWAKLFEVAVGLMLVGLGLSVAIALWRERVHLHAHWHEHGEQHRHLHSHSRGAHHDHLHRFRLEYKSLAVGMVHGLAGSAALLLLVLATVPSLGVGLVYILVFGAGSILGMVFLATAMSIPFAMSAERTARVHQTLRAAAALFSIVLGSTILFELLLV